MDKNKKLKQIPKFKNEDQERKFWATHDTTEYFDTTKPVDIDFSSLKPSTKPITIRIPVSMLSALKTLANKRDVPYQSLMKILLAEKLQDEIRGYRA